METNAAKVCTDAASQNVEERTLLSSALEAARQISD
jgi:hypothetical protein